MFEDFGVNVQDVTTRHWKSDGFEHDYNIGMYWDEIGNDNWKQYKKVYDRILGLSLFDGCYGIDFDKKEIFQLTTNQKRMCKLGGKGL